MIDSKNLDHFIEHLIAIKKQIKHNKEETKIVIDEWDLNSDQSKYRRELAY